MLRVLCFWLEIYNELLLYKIYTENDSSECLIGQSYTDMKDYNITRLI